MERQRRVVPARSRLSRRDGWLRHGEEARAAHGRSGDARCDRGQRTRADPGPAQLPAPGAGAACHRGGSRRTGIAGGRGMRIAFYGSSLTSSYWNGAATYYRGIIRALAGLGYDITFYEPDAYDRQKNRDIDPPPWCRIVVYPATREGVEQVTAQARHAEIVVKASGVGVFDDELLAAAMAAARRDALRIFWDVDAPATLAELAAHQIGRAHV